MLLKLDKTLYSRDELGEYMRHVLSLQRLEYSNIQSLLVYANDNKILLIKNSVVEVIFGYDKFRTLSYIEYMNKVTHTFISGTSKTSELLKVAIENLRNPNQFEYLKFSGQEEEIEIIQFILINHFGFRWKGKTANNIINAFKYLYADCDGLLMTGQADGVFNASPRKEFDLTSFIKDYLIFKNK